MTDIEATTEMLIRRPRNEVFDAFVDPATIEKFWLERTSGPLADGAVVEWQFLVPGARETVHVRDFVADERIGFAWSDGIVVTMEFHAVEAGTRLSIVATGFAGPDANAQAVNATEGFTIVACDLKCLLETGQSGGMVRDKALLIAASSSAA